MPLLHETLKELAACDFEWDKSLESFSQLDSIPVDVGILEKSSHVATIPGDMGWSDVGNWRALQDVIEPDAQGTVSNCRFTQVDSRNCILYSSDDQKMLSLVGVKDLVVVQTPDAVLICDRHHTEDVKKLVEKFQESELKDYL
jgi:mannose-1-phosphate guanylyltransferase